MSGLGLCQPRVVNKDLGEVLFFLSFDLLGFPCWRRNLVRPASSVPHNPSHSVDHVADEVLATTAAPEPAQGGGLAAGAARKQVAHIMLT
eukprot:SAG11_NODE_663_length_7869_cov_146.101158_5_plen_90_part_00